MDGVASGDLTDNIRKGGLQSIILVGFCGCRARSRCPAAELLIRLYLFWLENDIQNRLDQSIDYDMCVRNFPSNLV